MASFIPLHIHSDFSILDGLQSVEAIVKRAGELKIPALALTDMSNICGFIKFYSACRSQGIKPILGADVMVRPSAQGYDEAKPFKLTVLAMDRVGRQNLYDILSQSWLRSDAGEFNAATNYEELEKYNEGLIVLNGFRGDISALMQNRDKAGIEQRVEWYKRVFGDRFVFEITRTGRAGEQEFENLALNLCLKHDIAPVATNDTVFLYGENDIPQDGFSDYQIHDVRVAVQKGLRRGDKEIARIYSKEQYLKTPEEMAGLFSDIPEALENTLAIAQRCNVEIELDHPRLPHFATGDLSAADYLRQKAHEGLEERLNFLFPDPVEREKQRPVYEERLEIELNVIITMDFPGYFLIVMEFIQWSKDNGVSVGPGRGSGGGSLVAYSLKITDFDPLRFDLLFERFLNPERVSMPDFDVDFCQRNREKTLDHVRQRYGYDAVSQIATFGTMAPKAAIKDTGRALGMGYGSVDYVAKMLPGTPGLTFNAAMGIGKKGERIEPAAPDFVALYNKAVADDDRARVELIHIAMRLEGVIRNIGKHAAGVVISPTRTAEFTPLMLDSDGNSITQFDKKDVEHAGLVKFDFLGLTTLTIISDALQMINDKKTRLHQPPLDIHAVPYEDDASFKVLQQGQTTAVFQLESTGMRKLISQMKPDRFDDLIALVALYRPGPIKSGMVEHFVKRKHGEEPVAYPSPDFQDLDLKPILDSTYGVIVYQEQVMQIAQVLAGYSLGGADILRRAMGKKNPVEMAGQRSVFKEGAIKKGKDPDIAMKIFDQVEMFAEYGFNKSHSAAYALVAWWTLYLKTHYPAEFLAAMMTADRQHTEKLVTYIADCRRLNLKVNPPDVLVGKYDFTVNAQGEIVYGIGAVKGIGEAFVNRVVEVREQGGFSDFYDFAQKVGSAYINKRTLESLIMSGALDGLCDSRAQMMASVPNAIKYAQQKEADQSSGQIDLFAAMEDAGIGKPMLVDAPQWSDKYRLYIEKSVLGLYLSGHPINAYQKELVRFAGTSLAAMKNNVTQKPQSVSICGVVINSTAKISKQDDKHYYIIEIDDSTSQLELMIFAENAQAYEQILEKRKHAVLKGDAQDPQEAVPSPLVLIIRGEYYLGFDGVPKFRAKEILSLEEAREKHARSVLIKCTDEQYQQQGQALNRIILRNLIDANDPKLSQEELITGKPARRGCSLQLMKGTTLISFKNRQVKIDPSDDLIDSVRDLWGKDALAVNY